MKSHPISIACQGYGLAGDLLLPDDISSPVPAGLIIGGPGPLPLTRYTAEGEAHWPVAWAQALAKAGLAGLCYDQRGSGLSSGSYHQADWHDLYEDALATAELLALQPEVSKVVAIAWADGAGFALQLAAAGKVAGLILLAPGYLTAEARYAEQVKRLAASRGLSDRVVQLRVQQWQADVAKLVAQVEQGELTQTTLVGDQPVTTNLARHLAVLRYDPAALISKIKVPALILHGVDDKVIPPSESQELALHLGGPVNRYLYPDTNHFIFRSAPALAAAVNWVKRLV